MILRNFVRILIFWLLPRGFININLADVGHYFLFIFIFYFILNETDHFIKPKIIPPRYLPLHECYYINFPSLLYACVPLSVSVCLSVCLSTKDVIYSEGQGWKECLRD